MKTSLRLWNMDAEKLIRERGKSHRYWTRNRVYDIFFKTGFSICMGVSLFVMGGILWKGSKAVISHVGPEAEEIRKKMRADEIAKKQEQALLYLQNQERFDNIKKPENPDA